MNKLKRFLAIYMTFLEFAHILLGSIKTDDSLNRQKIGHPFLPDKSHSTIFVECMQLYTAVQLWKSTYCWIGQHSSWLSLQIRTESHRESPPQTPGRCTNYNHWGDNIFLRYCQRRKNLIHTNRCGDETEEQILQRKEQCREKGTEWVANQELSSMKPGIKEFTKIAGNTTSYSINGIEAKSRRRVEHDADLVLKNLKFKFFGQPHDEVLLTTDRRFKHYKANDDRIILKDG